MKITQVTYRRVYNLGNYETMHVEMTATIEPTETAQDAVKKLAEEAAVYRASVGLAQRKAGAA